MTTYPQAKIQLGPLTFRKAVEICLVALADGTDQGKRVAAEELRSMARNWDKWAAKLQAMEGSLEQVLDRHTIHLFWEEVHHQLQQGKGG